MDAVRSTRFVWSIAIAIATVGCDVGMVPPLGGGADAGRDASGDATGEDPANAQSFEAVLKPLATMNGCLDAACHGGVQSPRLSSYALLEAKYKMKPGAMNILVTKGPHQNVPFFDAAEQAMVAAWIDGLR